MRIIDNISSKFLGLITLSLFFRLIESLKNALAKFFFENFLYLNQD